MKYLAYIVNKTGAELAIKIKELVFRTFHSLFWSGFFSPSSEVDYIKNSAEREVEYSTYILVKGKEQV